MISVKVIVKPSTLFLLNEERGDDIANACLLTREEKVAIIYCDIICLPHVLDLISLEGLRQDERLSESLVHTTVPIIVAIICPIEILVLNGDVLNLPGRVTRRAFVHDTEIISCRITALIHLLLQQVFVHPTDLTQLAAPRPLILIDKEQVAKLVDCQATTGYFSNYGAISVGNDVIIEESEYILDNLITVADIKIAVFEVEGSVCRVIQV